MADIYTSEEQKHLTSLCQFARYCEDFRRTRTPLWPGRCRELADELEAGFARGEHLAWGVST